MTGSLRALRGAALAALALGALACSPTPPNAVPEDTPVVLISVDTLRSDRLPAYGYGEVATPAIDRLRADSILFRNAYCPVPLTLPSHVSALTGQLPTRHGVRDNMGYKLAAGETTYLPRRLRELGYRTGAAVSSFVLRGSSGLADGFDHYEDRIVHADASDVGSVQRSGYETLDRATDWLRSVGDDAFFLFFHIYEPHTPYTPPEPFASRYGAGYDAEVAAADDIVGKLLDELERLGRYDPALIFFFSDHGEHLGEHGYYEHGPLLYREALQVPLMLKLPGGERGGEEIERPAQLIDIAPTVLELLGTAAREELPGLSLLQATDSGGETPVVYGETIYPRVHYGWSDLTSLIDYPHHLIQGPDPELYDLASDPGEKQNLIRSRRDVAAKLRSRLADYEIPWMPPGAESAETRRSLEALGYLSGGAVEADGPLPDPKSRLHIIPVMSRGIKAFSSGEWQDAVATFREVLNQEPGMIDAWEKLGFALLELGKTDEASEAWQQAMRHSGGTPQVALNTAAGFLRAGRLDDAEAHARIALGVHELARDILAQVAVRKDELDRAEGLVEDAVAERGARLGPLITMAHLRLKQERYQEALELSEQVESEFGERTDVKQLAGVYFIRGEAHARLGQTAEAEKAFLREIELSPSSLASYTRLAYVYALENRGAEVGATLRRMVETNPRPAAYAEAVQSLRAMGDARSAAGLLRSARQKFPESSLLRELAG